MNSVFPLAVHALVYLLHMDGQTVKSNALAENICTNPARVRKILAGVCRAGLAVSERGQGNGYRAADNSEAITLADVLAATGEDPVTAQWRPGNMAADCPISAGMAKNMDAVYGSMNTACREVLRGITVGDMLKRLY